MVAGAIFEWDREITIKQWLSKNFIWKLFFPQSGMAPEFVTTDGTGWMVCWDSSQHIL